MHLEAAILAMEGHSPRMDAAERLSRTLDEVRSDFMEAPAAALADALRCHEVARSRGDQGMAGRALALQGAIAVHRGDLRGAVVLALEAEKQAAASGHIVAKAEVAALKAQLNFFTGSYAEAVSEAKAALLLAERAGIRDLSLWVRRITCVVFGNLSVQDLRERVEDTLSLALGDPREEAMSRSDRATMLCADGDLSGAEREIERGFAVLEGSFRNRFALAALHITRAEIQMAGGNAAEALKDAQRGIQLLAEGGSPNPYVLGAAVSTQVQALVKLGEIQDAQVLGESTLTMLGDRLPQTRGMILTVLAGALRDAGRLSEAYDTLARASALERETYRELAELQVGLERATLEAREARRHSDLLLMRNRQLADAHAELERRSSELEQAQGQLREQADRDWLTGLHNRRFLDRELDTYGHRDIPGCTSVAVIDIDHFKQINDRFGHSSGDRALVKLARILQSLARGHDLVVRSGGEEFVLLMPETDQRVAVAHCERIRQHLTEATWEELADDLRVTASIGIAWTLDPTAVRDTIRVADQRLYAAKRAGRDRVVAAGGTR